MIKKVYRPTRPLMKFFYEAPDDNTIDVKVAPHARRGTDYTQMNDDGNDSSQNDDIDSGDSEDYSDYNDDTNEGDTNSNQSDQPEPDAEDSNQQTDEPETSDQSGDDSGDEEPVDDDGSDYSDSNDSTDGDAGDSGDDDSSSPPPSPDSYKLYNLYKKFINLYTLNKSFITRLDTTILDDYSSNAVVKTVGSNLRNLNDILYDFMTVKYSTATYIQAMMFFHSAVAAIQLNFELMRNNHINFGPHGK